MQTTQIYMYIGLEFRKRRKRERKRERRREGERLALLTSPGKGRVTWPYSVVGDYSTTCSVIVVHRSVYLTVHVPGCLLEGLTMYYRLANGHFSQTSIPV